MESPSDRPDREPTREEVDRLEGPVVLEFGAQWCGYCQALAPRLAEMLEEHPAVRHIKVEDGPGKPLGRSFLVKLWPTLVFLRDGQVFGQVSRPHAKQVREGLLAIDPSPGEESGGHTSSP
jgi:thioredoxin 1